jgi:hypothetical protein
LVFKPAGTVTGLYREDYGYNATAAAFTMYRDVWREHQMSANETNPTDDSYEIRIVARKKDKS